MVLISGVMYYCNVSLQQKFVIGIVINHCQKYRAQPSG